MLALTALGASDSLYNTVMNVMNAMKAAVEELLGRQAPSAPYLCNLICFKDFARIFLAHTGIPVTEENRLC